MSVARARRRRHRGGFLRALTWLLLLLVLWLAGVAGWIVWVGERNEAQPADAIVVLGAAAYDAKPSPVLEERLNHALDLYRDGYARTLIFTGGYGTGARFSESQVARRYALRHDVPEDAILIETRSRNTRDNLIETRRLMREHGLHAVIVVSDPLHMARAMRLCGELGIRAYGSSTPSSRFRSFQTRWPFLVQEVYFFHRDLYDRLAGHFRRATP